MAAPVSNARLTFGLYEVDLETGELWRAGRRLKMQSQPFKVLAALLERPGEVVTREELQLRLWGKDTIVDFDHSLGTAINKIREALGDSADNPRFVETLARRGYRFIAPVSSSAPPPTSELTPGDAAAIRLVPSAAPPQQTAFPGILPVGHHPLSPSDSPAPRRRSFSALTAVAAALAIIAAAAAGFYLGSARSSTGPIRITQVTQNGRISPGAPSMESLPAAATDGVRIFASVIENGRSALSQVSIHTGDVQPLPLPSEIAAPTLGDISPDGSRLLLRSHLSPESEQPLWVVPTSGGSALRISNILAHDATWMPDGKGILYAAGNELAITHLQDDTSTPFATLPLGRAFWLRWSPDGRLLRFTILDPILHTFSLWEIPLGSHTARPVLKDWTVPANECCGSWTADGKFYVFQSSHGGNIDLWSLNGATTSNPSRITNGPLSYQAPLPDRTGHRIFFLGLDSKSETQRYDAKSREFIPVHNFLSASSRISFSRDGQWVAWPDLTGHLWRARVDGSEKIQLTPDSMQVFVAFWSPDGKQLALMAREPGTSWQIYRISADGGSPERLLKEDRNAGDPSWSADGQSLVFGRVTDLMGKENQPRDLQILNLNTHQTTKIPGSEGLFSPRWSPDGRYIAALSLDQRRLALYDTTTRTWKTLANTSVADPVWSFDSKAIYIHAFMADTQPIYRVSVPDGHLEEAASLSGFRAEDTADYFFVGITPDNVPLVRARTSTGNLYSLDLDNK
jgi:Tol biopolymer transport system component/DNA-binding winged helix-turn-helix (wHTH) protein